MYRLLNLRRKLHANFLCLKKHSKLCCRTKYFWAADVFFSAAFLNLSAENISQDNSARNLPLCFAHYKRFANPLACALTAHKSNVRPKMNFSTKKRRK